MDKGEAVGALYVEIRAQNEISKELTKIQREATKGAENIEDQFNSLRLSIRTDLMRKNISQIRQDHSRLKEELEKQIVLDASYGDLEKLKVELEESEHALKRFARQAEKTEKEVDEGFISKAKTKFSSLASAISAMFAGLAIGSFLKSSVEAFYESEKAAAGLEQQLGYTSDALFEYAAAIQNTTVFEDDSVVAAMTRIAAFTKDEEQIKALTQASLDLAAAKGMDLASASDMVAKSFGSETNALARSGIEVNAVAGSTERLYQVTEGIARLYGGQASAQAQTYGGKMEILKNKFGDLKEQIGQQLAPAIGALGTYFGKTTDQMKKGDTAGSTLKKTFNAIAIVGISLFTSLKIVWIALTTLIAGVIGFANLGIQALLVPFKTLMNIIEAVADLGPSLMAIITGDWANVDFGKVTSSLKKAFLYPLADVKNAFDRLVQIGKDGWGKITEEAELAKSFGGKLNYESNLKENPDTSESEKPKGITEADVKDNQEKLDMEAQQLKEYYDKVKWLDKDYQKFREKQIADEIKEHKKKLGAKFNEELYFKTEMDKLEEENRAWQEAEDQRLKERTSAIFNKISEMESKAGRIKGSIAKIFTTMFEIDKGYGSKNNIPAGDFRPRGMNEDGTIQFGNPTPTNDYESLYQLRKRKEKFTGLEYLKDFGAIDAVQDEINKSFTGKFALDALQDAVGNTLSLIRIRFAEDASEMEKIWGGMINNMIDKLAGLLSQWLIFNTIAAFIPGAGFGSIGFGKLLGLPEAATGGNFLGTNNGVLKLATGGDFIVPQGFANDSYPMLVQSGERVKVTPSGKVGDDVRLLSEIKNAIEANTLDRRMLGSRPVIVQPKISIGIRDLTKEVQKTNKTITREGWKSD